MSTGEAIHWRSFSLPKHGHRADEYEDACAGDPGAGRFAVADGASESSFAGLWARLLTEAFVRGEGDPAGWLGPPRRRWADEVGSLPLPWYAEEKREQGAFATFLGLAVRLPESSHRGRWKALAVGDSCFFHVRQDRLLVAFPMARADDFGNQPVLLGSRPTGAVPKPRTEWGKWQAGDRFFLMTDALAQWFLRRHEQGRGPWRSLERRLAAADAAAALTAYVEQLRACGELKNDDVTVMMIEL